MHTLTTLSISSLSLFIVRMAMMPSPAAAANADSLEPTDYKTSYTSSSSVTSPYCSIAFITSEPHVRPSWAWCQAVCRPMLAGIRLHSTCPSVFLDVIFVNSSKQQVSELQHVRSPSLHQICLCPNSWMQPWPIVTDTGTHSVHVSLVGHGNKWFSTNNKYVILTTSIQNKQLQW